MRKNISLIILFILIVFIIIMIPGCAADGENDIINDNDLSSEQSESVAEDVSEKIPDPILKNYDLNGRTYNLLVPASAGWVNSRDFEVFEEMSGEPVNDAVHDRIVAVEELYNCVIKPIYSSSIISDARKDILAEGNAYDVLMPALTEVNTIAGEGLLLDMNKIDTLHFDMPWWGKDACNNLSIMNRLYYTLGDISVIDNDGLCVLSFNKALLADNKLDPPYKYVYDDVWTFNKFYDICRGVSRDLDGDGVMTKEDQYGYVTDFYNIIIMIYAGGERLVTKNNDDIPYPSIDNERVMGIIDKVIEIFNDKTTFAQTALFGDHGQANKYFMNNQMLFREVAMFRYTQIREMESDFGFIPLPKYDETQDRYYHTYSWASPGVAIPVTANDPEETGAVLEALAYYGRLMVLPAYYEINLQTKITRDEDSPKMLDIIFDSATVDLGIVYNFGGMREMFMQFVTKNENTFPSAYASIEPKILAEIEKLVETFKAVS